MVLKEDQERVRNLLTETVLLLCKSGLHFKSEFNIEGLIGITVDQEDVFLVSIKETIQNQLAEVTSEVASPSSSSMASPRASQQSSRRRKRRAHDQADSTLTRLKGDPLGSPTMQDMAGTGGEFWDNEDLGSREPVSKRVAMDDSYAKDMAADRIPKMEDPEEDDVVVIKEELADFDSEGTNVAGVDSGDIPMGSIGNHGNQSQSMWDPGSLNNQFNSPDPALHAQSVQEQQWITAMYTPKKTPAQTLSKNRRDFLATKILTFSGPYVPVRSVQRHNNYYRANTVAKLMQDMTVAREDPSYVGEFREVQTQGRAVRVFYKCPPDNITDSALEHYRVARKVYQECFQEEYKSYQPSREKDLIYRDLMAQNSPFL